MQERQGRQRGSKTDADGVTAESKGEISTVYGLEYKRHGVPNIRGNAVQYNLRTFP
jgi:hypothetical protein